MPNESIMHILDQARWAPSGDNMQTWRFEIIDEKHFVVHGFDTRDHCVYDLEGHASQLALGALLESIAIAASEQHLKTDFKLRTNFPETKTTIDVNLIEDLNTTDNLLRTYLPLRTVQRRTLKTTALSIAQKTKLEQAAGDFYSVKWLEGSSNRMRTAWLMFKNAKLRLTLPEAFPTHSTIIEWNAKFSDDKIPDQAVGLDPLATKLMRWALKSWDRVNFLNTYLFGTLLPRIELDLLPGICCAAHFALIAKQEPKTLQDFLDAGRAVQRFWLTATQLDLQLQPEMTPLIFSGYARKQIHFTQVKNLENFANELKSLLDDLLGAQHAEKTVFLGRIGKGQPANSRSLRLPINKLIVKV